MKKILAALLIISCLGMMGCGAKSTSPDDMLTLQQEAGTFPQNYEELVKNYFYYKLYDPFSAQYEFMGEPVLTQRYSIFTGSHGVWSGNVRINAKNKLGGYTGFKIYQYTIKNRKIINVTIL